MHHPRILSILAISAPFAAIAGCSGLPMFGTGQPPPPVIAGPVVPAYVQSDVIGGRAARIKKARAAGAKLLFPAAVFDYVNREEAELRRETAGTGVDVIRSGELLLLRLPASGTFDVGRADIRTEALSTLTEIALTLKTYKQSMVDVLGHSDSTGNTASNEALSQRRAQAVAKFLSSKGVAQARIATRGYAASQPIADNGTETGRALNRRVEIKLVPLR